jgi:hypothetical protein
MAHFLHSQELTAMNVTARITGGNRFAQKLKQYPQQLNRTVESVCNQEARALAVSYGAATMPGPGLQEEGKPEKFRKLVESDVRRVFATRSDPGSVFELLKKLNLTLPNGSSLANAYWSAYKRKKPRAMASLLRAAGLPEGLNPAAHKAARTAKNGRVAKDQKPVSLANDASLRVFIRKQRTLVGFAKAGWYCAAKALGGRVRSNLRSADGRRGTAEIFPAYIRSLARRFPDAGGARVTSDAGRVEVAIFTNVRHAAEAMPENLRAGAEAEARESFAAALGKALREMNQKIFGSRAA